LIGWVLRREKSRRLNWETLYRPKEVRRIVDAHPLKEEVPNLTERINGGGGGGVRLCSERCQFVALRGVNRLMLRRNLGREKKKKRKKKKKELSEFSPVGQQVPTREADQSRVGAETKRRVGRLPTPNTLHTKRTLLGRGWPSSRQQVSERGQRGAIYNSTCEETRRGGVQGDHRWRGRQDGSRRCGGQGRNAPNSGWHRL